MKKIKYVLLVMTLLVVFTGCKSNKDNSGDEVPAAAENGGSSAEAETKESTAETENQADDATAEQPASEEITITHDLGETKLTTNPQRVVVFDYGILDALDYAGVDTIIGVPQSGTLPEHLAKFSDGAYANAGSLKEADFEKINEIKPDLILITARMSESYTQLSEIAPTVYLPMPGATYLQSFEQNMNTLASIFTARGEKFMTEVENIRQTVAQIKEKVDAGGFSALMIQANDGDISVFGLGSRYAVLYNDLGFTVTDTGIEESTHGQAATFEYVAEQNPDYLFVVDRSAAIGSGEEQNGAAQLLDNDLINNMDAAKNDRIAYLDSTNWYTVSGGISSTISMLEEVKAALDK